MPNNNPTGIGGARKGAPSRNPSGRAPLTEDQRLAQGILAAATPAAARRVIELMASGDEKIALAAAKTIIDKSVPDKLDGDALQGGNPFAELTTEQLVAFVRAAKATQAGD